MKKTAKKTLHFKVSERLFGELDSIGYLEGRTPSAQAAYDLEVILPIVQSEVSTPIARRLDMDPLVCELKPGLDPEFLDFLVEQARGLGVSPSHLARDYLWVVAGMRRKVYPRGVRLMKEEFRKRIREHLRERFSKIQ